MRKYPLVTIGIPTYNRASGYLKEALESALHQTYPNIEIIVSDNHSTDNTESLVKSYDDPRIRYFKQAQSIPPNDNFNFCLSKANGGYFNLLHDDDQIDQDFVDVCMKAADYNIDVGIVRSGTRRIDDEGKVLGEHPNLVGGLPTKEFVLAWFHNKSDLYLCSTLFNTDRLREMGGFRSKNNLFQDVLAELQLAAQFGRTDVLEVKASFRRHSSQFTTAAAISDWCEDSLFLLDRLCDLIPDKDPKFRRAGTKKFAAHNYGLAKRMRSPAQRYVAYFVVCRAFGYRYIPPLLERFRAKFSRVARVFQLSGRYPG